MILHVPGRLPREITLEAFVLELGSELSAEELESVREVAEGRSLAYVTACGDWGVYDEEPIGLVCVGCVRSAAKNAIEHFEKVIPDLLTRADLVNNAFASLTCAPIEGHERRVTMLLVEAVRRRWGKGSKLSRGSLYRELPAEHEIAGPLETVASMALIDLLHCDHMPGLEGFERFEISEPAERTSDVALSLRSSELENVEFVTLKTRSGIVVGQKRRAPSGIVFEITHISDDTAILQELRPDGSWSLWPSETVSLSDLEGYPVVD